jgi:BTB/POZ domain
MDIYCSFRPFDWTGFGILYTCYVDTAITHRCSVNSFKGIHEEGKTDADVLALSFNDISVAYLPYGLSNFFPQLQILEVESCGLKRISARDLVVFPHLEALFFMDNHLKSLPNDLFVDLPAMKSICFFNNKLEHLNSELLKPIPDKRWVYIDFRNNTKINALYCNSSNQGVKSVKKIKEIIDSNCLPPCETNEKRVEEAQENLSDGFKELWQDVDFTDFAIVAGNESIPVHKCVLAVRLPMFKNFLQNNERANRRNEMRIAGFHAEAVEDFLLCLYSGDIFRDENALEVFKLAMSFDVPKVQHFCEAIMIRDMNPQIAIEAFKIAAHYGLDDLFDAAFDEIKQMFPDIKFHDALKKQPQTVLLMIEKKAFFDSREDLLNKI